MDVHDLQLDKSHSRVVVVGDLHGQNKYLQYVPYLSVGNSCSRYAIDVY
jgi:hypothetical protein